MNIIKNKNQQDVSHRSRNLWYQALRRLRQHKLAVAGAVLITLFVGAAILAPCLSPYSYAKQNLAYGPQPPSSRHWMGTDSLGRDLFTRILYGARISFAVGILGALVSTVIGVSYGSFSGFLGGKVDTVMMRVVDILYSLPYMFFVIILVVVFGRNLVNLFIALGVVQWLTMSRIVRGQVLSLKEKEFIEAARALGVGKGRLIFRHIIPNLIGPVIAYATLTVPAVMLQEAFLSFLGLGVQAPMTSWGTLTKEGAEVMSTYWWLLIFPAVTLAVTLFSLNFLGDGLRDALDPKQKRI